MSSAAQVLANRQNSLQSTGPKTGSGKAISSQNATRHGLTSREIVIPGEDPAEYDALRDSVTRQYAPANETERTLVEEVAAGSWRLVRARRHETAILKKLIGDNVADPDAAFAELFVEKPKEIQRLLRYITTIERAYYRALNKLELLQKERAAEEEQLAIRQACLSQMIRRQPAPPPENGFVSQSPEFAQSAGTPAVLRSAA